MAVAQPHVEPRDHAVLFYRRDDELRDKVGRFLTDALRAGGVSIIAATSERTRAFGAAMESLGVAVSDMRSSGRLISIDAEEVAIELGEAHRLALVRRIDLERRTGVLDVVDL